jgi:putative transcriptional regulator
VSALAPAFLVAVPQLGDPNFSRAVILMMEYSAEGALGIVVNRPSPVMLKDVARAQGLRMDASLGEEPCYVGGPVQPERGFVLHDRDDLAESVPLVDRLHVSSSMESLKMLLEGPPERYRLCLGYAGWGPGQLEEELKEGAWIVAPASLHHVLETPAPQAWDAVLRAMGIDPMMLLHATGLH